MRFQFLRLLAFVLLGALLSLPAAAQAPPPAPASAGATVCGVQVPPPSNLPPANSGPVLWQIFPGCFEAQGNVSLIDPQTYLYYIELKNKVSKPSENIWVPYTD